MYIIITSSFIGFLIKHTKLTSCSSLLFLAEEEEKLDGCLTTPFHLCRVILHAVLIVAGSLDP